MSDHSVSANCQACGSEYLESELRTVKLSGFGGPLLVCDACLNQTAEDSFKGAAELLDEIVLIAKATSGNPERRLRAIKALIGE
jgi:hypothetical protein